MNVTWSPLALEQLSAIAEFIALDNSSAAENWVNSLFDKAERLASFPEMGRTVPELNQANYRELIIGNYRLIYKITNEINVLTVRNCRKEFGEGEL